MDDELPGQPARPPVSCRRAAATAIPGRSRGAREHRLGLLHQARRRQGGGVDGSSAWKDWAPLSSATSTRSWATPSWPRFEGRTMARSHAHRPHRYRLRRGHGRRAALPRRGRRAGPRSERHEGRSAGRPVRARSAAHRRGRGPRLAAGGKRDLRRQPRRGDRLAVQHAHHRIAGAPGRCRAGARVGTRERRHRLGPQGHAPCAGPPSWVVPPMPAWRRSAAAAPCSRLPTRPWHCMP